MTWTREMDAHIARHCEGWEPVPYQEAIGSTNYGVWSIGTNCMGHANVPVVTPVPSYTTDPAACIRAAEAWRKKDQDVDRTVHLNSAIERGEVPFRAECHENYRVVDERGERYPWRVFHGESKEGYCPALAQALLRATGWVG